MVRAVHGIYEVLYVFVVAATATAAAAICVYASPVKGLISERSGERVVRTVTRAVSSA